MLVYGDHVRARDPRDVLASVMAALVETSAMPAGLARHEALVRCFLDASALAQGLADHGHEVRGYDARTPVDDAVMAFLVELARAIAASWDGGFVAVALPDATSIDRRGLPDAVRMRRPEGHAFYAVYPEGYLLAAREASSRIGTVIGIRSIGTGLAAILAAATGARLPSTVRPGGDPHARSVRAAPELVREWTMGRDAIAIADEGPGLSGSSFGAVCDVLASADVPHERLVLFPSHEGDLGPRASAAHRERWHRVRRHVVTVDGLLLRGTLATWIAERVGPLLAPLEDLSGGAWRRLRYAREDEWPASVTFQERRKLLARTASGTWLARFVGLGEHGEQALARASVLHAAGFTPEVVGLCHGFLLERWLEPVRPLDPAFDRRASIAHVGRYLGHRARALPAREPDAGASVELLIEMTRRNATLALGESILPALDRWARRAPSDHELRRVEVDARLHAWEWLVTGERLWKTDAIDHAAAHDLVGAQDVAWDVAGAISELALDASELRSLLARTGEHAGRAVDPTLVAFLRPSYLAFQLGRHALAIDAVDPAEASRLRALVARYRSELTAALMG
jgi:hypothetical protein